ncbi:hypothetical protein G647_08035 [Cladophialophora carrionii CBS 160.54]|uniref:Uncharacterized protein n=1 Tax=Cladophialophora carrionii CBS 160.54 TaxID=1279043 RepID=V9D5W1_9EURO|nr:uncharacterized protein G647_08035 [Cladophialophora carrionii CBS 160.54]ETI21688.1 hypothetical protein G647_08035 [Cladophialophora carrionii CBS 160.54]
MASGQGCSSTDYAATVSGGSHPFTKDNRTNERWDGDNYYGDHQRYYHGQPAQPDWHSAPNSPPPRHHGIRILGAAGPEHDICFPGGAERGEHRHYVRGARSEHHARNDLIQPDHSRRVPSRCSPRARSSSNSDRQDLDRLLNDQSRIIQRKDGKINEQQKLINKLTSEKKTLATTIEDLRFLKDSLTRKLHEKDDELQRVNYHDPEGSHRRDDLTAAQDRKLQDSNRYINNHLDQIRNLGGLPVPPPLLSTFQTTLLAFQGADLATPVERRLQALGATMDENDLIESQQPVIVSKHLRNCKDNENSSWSRPVAQTVLWPRVKDDPAFADVGHGPPVTFDVLWHRIRDITSSHVANDDQYDSHSSTFDERYDPQDHSPLSLSESGLSNKEEERLAVPAGSNHLALARSHMRHKGRGRPRSRSPGYKRHRDQRQKYRQRRYEGSNPGPPSTDRDRDRHRYEVGERPRDVKTMMDADTVRNIEARSGSRQPNQKTRKGAKRKGKRKQQQQRKQEEKSAGTVD